jgi:hypothetical protein
MILSMLESIHHDLCTFHFIYTNILINILTFGQKCPSRFFYECTFYDFLRNAATKIQDIQWSLTLLPQLGVLYLVLNPFASDSCAIPNPNPFCLSWVPGCLSIPSPWPFYKTLHYWWSWLFLPRTLSHVYIV